MVDSIWGGGVCNFVSKDAEGLSGGMIIIWDTNVLEVFFSFSGVGFVGVCARKRRSSDVFFMVNVYSPCDWGGKN